MVLEKNIIYLYNVLAARNSREFLGFARLENSKQCDEDAQFFAMVSSNQYHRRQFPLLQL